MHQIIELPAFNLASEWIALLFLSILTGLLWIKVNYSRRFELLFGAVINPRFLRQLMREELVFSHRASIVLTVVFFLTGSVYLYEIDNIFNLSIIDSEGFSLWFNYLILLTMIYTIKVSSMQLVKLLANGDFGLEEYQYNVFLINNAAGVVLFPFVLVSAYLYKSEASGVLIAGGIVIGLFLFYRLTRGLFSAFSNRIPLFYIILYLCSLEILPLLILFKALQG
jgi:hypothetical protein